LHFPHALRGALQGGFDIRAYILRTDMAIEFRLLHELTGLRQGAAKQQGAPGLVQLGGQLFQHA
jgi:hypothetical protein